MNVLKSQYTDRIIFINDNDWIIDMDWLHIRNFTESAWGGFMSCGVSDWTLRIVWLVDRPPAILPPLHLYLNTNQGTLTKLAFFQKYFVIMSGEGGQLARD